MANVVDYTKLKKEYLTVKLNDEMKTVLMICTPNKRTLDEFNRLNEIVEDEGADTETVGELYRVCAHIMSDNKGGIKIKPEYLEELFDIEDITVFFRAYGEFIQGITSSKN